MLPVENVIEAYLDLVPSDCRDQVRGIVWDLIERDRRYWLSQIQLAISNCDSDVPTIRSAIDKILLDSRNGSPLN
jgi:hypothetical protein